MLQNINKAFADDPRFTGIEAGTVEVVGGAVKVKVLVGIAGVGIYMPLSVQLPFAA